MSIALTLSHSSFHICHLPTMYKAQWHTQIKHPSPVLVELILQPVQKTKKGLNPIIQSVSMVSALKGTQKQTSWVWRSQRGYRSQELNGLKKKSQPNKREGNSNQRNRKVQKQKVCKQQFFGMKDGSMEMRRARTSSREAG